MEQKLIAGDHAALVENDLSKANRIFQELAALFPKDKRVQLFLAQTYGGLQKYDEQLAAVEKAIALDRTFAPAHEALGYFYRWREKPEKAEAAFKEYARLSPKEANSHDQLGDIYMKTGRFEDAIKEYEEAVRMDPAFYYSQQKIGSSLYLLGKFEEGRQDYLKTMDMPARTALVTVGDLQIDPYAHTVTVGGRPVELTPREFDLLHTLALEPNRVIAIDELLDRVWGAEFIGQPQVVYVHIRWLREKIETDPGHPQRILSVHGVGYKLNPKDS